MSSKKNRPLPQSLGLPFTGADSHAHLDDERLLPDLSGMLERAASSGVSLIVHMFLQHERYASNRDLILNAAAALPKAPDICFVRGLHPEDVLAADEEEWEHLVDVVKNDPLIRAIGEIGLDYHYEEGYSPSALQEPWFRRQLRLARELDKPVVIHSREAWDRMFAILDEEDMPGRPLLWHCFGGDAARARQIMERGWHIAFGGAATFKANAEVREALHAVLPERLMLETDCPYLAPEPWRGKTNEPALAVFTAERLAPELAMSTEELWTLAGENARRFFGM
ncbi:TatD family hydrolase [uncultured Mailhella sp.]|uniref:TatD family hydrolase n=1 Tax=uncultured Mailhella sp. TaxID=1981031 RepID=UPI0025D6191C|nr:TatD family hydrolase [uncultured Mailhella sp.]